MNKITTKHSVFYALSVFHITSILIGITLTQRFFQLPIHNFIGAVDLTGGLFFIPVVFFVQDIVTEVYHFSNTKKMILTSIAAFLFYVLILNLLAIVFSYFNPDSGNDLLVVAETIPRQAVSFTFSLLAGGLINAYILTKLQFLLNDRFLAIRFIASTAVGELIFQTLAISIAWFGKYDLVAVIPLAIGSYIFKISFEILSTPINIYLCKYLKGLPDDE